MPDVGKRMGLGIDLAATFDRSSNFRRGHEESKLLIWWSHSGHADRSVNDDSPFVIVI
jgi:hypothetical protein